MKRFLLVTAAAFALAACGGDSQAPLAPPDQPSLASGDAWTLFTTETPNETLDASPGWEVGTQFYVTKASCVAYLRFWRAVGETGTNRIRLWDPSTGTQITSRIVSSTGSGWQTEYFSSIVCLTPYKYYRISVNTNVKQVKTFGAFSGGPIVNGPMVAVGGYYGQPTGSMPTTSSPSNFFVDLIVVES